MKLIVKIMMNNSVYKNNIIKGNGLNSIHSLVEMFRLKGDKLSKDGICLKMADELKDKCKKAQIDIRNKDVSSLEKVLQNKNKEKWYKLKGVAYNIIQQHVVIIIEVVIMEEDEIGGGFMEIVEIDIIILENMINFMVMVIIIIII